MPRTVQIDLEATTAGIPAGQRLALVIDTEDPRYAADTPLAGTLSFSSLASAPSRSRSRVPLR